MNVRYLAGKPANLAGNRASTDVHTANAENCAVIHAPRKYIHYTCISFYLKIKGTFVPYGNRTRYIYQARKKYIYISWNFDL